MKEIVLVLLLGAMLRSGAIAPGEPGHNGHHVHPGKELIFEPGKR